MSVDPNQIFTFNKSIVLSYNEGAQQTTNGTIGQLRFNQTTLKFEGYHSNAGALLGEIWRPLTQDIASASNLGVIKVGTNLTINPATGILSSVASGTSRIHALVIEVSPIVGAADYQSINEAISHAIGTPAGGYIDGSITSNLGSPPSPTWPFVIQLGPGQYSEPTNQIVLPDYVSLRGEDNYNSVITQNTGSTSNIAAGSLIIAGQNTDIRNLAITLADGSASNYSNGIYVSDKTNVIIDNCIITQASGHHTTTLTTCIYMTNGGLTNQITNNRIFINAQYSPTINRTAIQVDTSVPVIENNHIEIESLCGGTLTGIELTNCYSSQDINTIPMLESNIINIKNANTVGTTNQCISLVNSAASIIQCQLESNSPQVMNNNWGIAFSSASPLAQVVAASNFSFSYNSGDGIYSITSANAGVANFITAGFLSMQHIKVAGSNSNDGYYRIGQVSSTQLVLEPYNAFNTEAASSNTITITALYDVQIEGCYIRGNTSSISKTDSNSNYYFSLIGARLEGGAASISPSISISSGYTIITVGKENSDYPSLSSAIAGLPPTTEITNATRYKIFIRAGIYIEPTQVIFPDNVDIEGAGQNLTIIQTSVSSAVSGNINSACAGFLLGSNAKVSNITFINAGTSAAATSTSACLYTNPASNKHNITLDNVSVQLAGLAKYNYGVVLDTCSNVAITGVNVASSLVAGNNSTINCCMNLQNSYQSIQLNQITLASNNPASNENLGLLLNNTSSIINNFNINVSSATGTNLAIRTYNDQSLQSQITNELFAGVVSSQDSVDYSIYNDSDSTIILDGVEINGPTYTSPISSRISCIGCFTTNPNGAGIGTGFASLSSRGENEQALDTITIGDTAGARGSTGIGNLLIGVMAGSNVSTDSRSTVLGSNAGSVMSGTHDNTLVGFSAGNTLTTGSDNTALGSNAGASLTEGGGNTLIGKDAGTSIITGAGNTMLGYQAGLNENTGNVNVFIGYAAGISATSGDYNVMLGTNAGHFLNSGTMNTFIGSSAGFNGTNVSGSVLIGSGAGASSQSSNLTVIGTESAFNCISGINNTILGFQAGYNSNGNANTIIGNKAGFSAVGSVAACNTLIGNEAGYSLTTGVRNILIGATTDVSGAESQDAAGWALSTGQDNTLIGNNAFPLATTSINNVALGNNTGTNITTAGNNVLLGTNAGQGLTNIGNSVMIGTSAGQGNATGNAVLVGYGAGIQNTASHAMGIGYNAASNVAGDFNTFIGYNSGGLPKVQTTGAYNLAVGPYTGFNLSSGSRNVMVGSGDVSQSVGRQITTGSDNTLLGFKAGRAIQTGSNNTLIGSNAGASLSSGINNLVLGYQAAFNLSSGSYNTVLGPQAGYFMNDASYNISTGYQAAYNQQSGSGNINMGYKAGYTMVNQSNNIHIGYQAGYTSTADNNIFVGANAGTQNTVGINNIFMGTAAGAGANTYGTIGQQQGNYNTFLGYYAGNANYSGTKNIFMGYQAGRKSELGSKNIFIGDNTGSQGDTSHNIFIGTARNDAQGVGYQATTVGGMNPNAGEYNVFVGHDVGIENTTGYDNVFLGDGAGKANLEGHDNIYMGTQAGYSSNTINANYNIAIGYNTALNNQSGQENIIIGKSAAGAGTSTNFSQNIIIGSDAGQNIQQNNQIFIGTQAGQNNTTGSGNIFIGLEAGSSNQTSNNNVVIGSQAGDALIGSSGIGNNTIIGAQAGTNIVSGTNNIYLGAYAGTEAITSINNVVIGANAMSVGDSSNVVIIGNLAGKNNTADGIIAIGYLAGKENNTGVDNIFIGKAAGEFTTTGDSNIMMGIQSGRDNISGANNIYVGKFAGSVNNGDSNIAMGSGALQLGTDATQNVCIGQNAGKNTNSNYNIFIGNDAGAVNTVLPNNIAIGSNSYSNGVLSLDSLMIGASSVQYGTGGSYNNMIGSRTGYNLGNPNFYIAYGDGIINNYYIVMNLSYTALTYYFKQNDFIYVSINNTLSNSYIYQSVSFDQLSPSQSILYINQPLDTSFTNAQIIVAMTTNVNTTGPTDNSKASSDTCIGYYTGYNLTTGSKNAAIGDNALYNNLVGRYNITLGTQSGYGVNTDNNLCLGTNAGYSLDTYKDTTSIQDLQFYQSNNTIYTTSLDTTSFAFGTVIEIDGSSSNDARYSIKDVSSNTIIVAGYPQIVNDGLPSGGYNPTDITVPSSSFQLINQTINNSNCSFNNISSNGYITIFTNSNQNADDIVSQFNKASYIKVQNTEYNDSLYAILNITSNNSNVIIKLNQNIFDENNSNVNINTNCIENLNTSCTSIFSTYYATDPITLQFGLAAGTYNIDPDLEFVALASYNDLPYGIVGVPIQQQLTNLTTANNILYSQGSFLSITNYYTDLSNLASNYFYTLDYVYFRASDNTIHFSSALNSMTVPIILENYIYKITGTLNNNGYYLVSTFLQSYETYPFPFAYGGSVYAAYININYPINDEIIAPVSNVLLEPQLKGYVNLQNIFNSGTSWNGTIIQSDNSTSEDNKLNQGAYVMEFLNNGFLGLDNQLNNTIMKRYDYPNPTTAYTKILGKGNTFNSNFGDQYLSSSDYIFQNNTLSRQVSFTSNSIVSTYLYAFADIVAPVMIKIEDSASNDGFYIVNQNDYPYDTMYLNKTVNIEGPETITIKTNSISSYLQTSNLAIASSSNNYYIFGSKYNDGLLVKPYSNDAIDSVSVYLNPSISTLTTETNNDTHLFLLNDNSFTVSPNIGYFQSFTISGISCSLDTDSINALVSNPSPEYDLLNSLVLYTYIKITGTPGGTQDGLYIIGSKSYVAGIFNINVGQRFIRNGIYYDSTNPFGVSGPYISINLISNQFIMPTIPANTNNIDARSLAFFQASAKFLTFREYNTLLQKWMNKTLTFEVDSIVITTFPSIDILLYGSPGTPTIAIPFVETCPNMDSTNPISFCIEIGSPVNSTIDTVDINRKTYRPIMYSESTIYYYGTFDYYTSNNSVSFTPNLSVANYNPYFYSKNINQNDFSLFKPGYIFCPIESYNIGSGVPTALLIKNISDDKLTLYFDNNYTTISNDSSYPLLTHTIYLSQYLTNDNILNSFSNSYSPTAFFLGLSGSVLATTYSSTRISYISSAFDVDSNLSFQKYMTFQNTTPNSELDVGYSYGRPHTLILDETKITTNYTPLSFHNQTITGNSDISFYTGNNTITSITTDLSSFLKHEYIQVSGTSNNNGIYRISDLNDPTTNYIVLSSNTNIQATEYNTSAVINANNINSSNIALADLSIFGNNQTLIINRTNLNNTNYIASGTSNSPYSIYIINKSVITEKPNYCVLEKSILIDESSIVSSTSYDISFNNTNPATITSSNVEVDLSVFRPKQTIAITGTSNNNSSGVIINSEIIPSASSLSLSTGTTLINEISTNATLNKLINFTVIGEPIITSISSNQNILYHYQDAEGNNAMIGSFAGQYVGSLNNAIYNMMIGSRCGQVNHGSGNIFIGNESQLATEATQGATTYSNKFAVYKNNFIGIPNNPLIGGDFGSGRVGINTINPESFNTSSDVTVTDTKLVVNGGAIANSFSPFTGCHVVNFDSTSNSSSIVIQPGMIMSSIGKVDKPMIINTFATVKPSDKTNDKAVFGVYAYSETNKASSEPEYIINSDGKYVRNSSYTNEMITLNYVAALGEGCILITNYAGEIQNGDYITSSPIAGYGALQSDDIMHSYTVAKCTESINWNNIQPTLEYQDQKYKMYLAACTYHCG